MRRALNAIQHVQVIRHHARIKQGIAQIGQHAGAVIHAAQQHALVQQRHARFTQTRHRRAKVIVNFVRVVDMVHQQNLQS